MSIVGGLDLHRRQLTYDYLCLETGEIERGRIVPGDREHLRVWLARFAGEEDVEFAVEGALAGATWSRSWPGPRLRPTWPTRPSSRCGRAQAAGQDGSSRRPAAA